jgi:hypothetical protein
MHPDAEAANRGHRNARLAEPEERIYISLLPRIRTWGSDCLLGGVGFDIEVGTDLPRCLRITKFDGGCAAA